MSEQIRLARPDVGEAEVAALAGVVASGMLTMGPKVPAFERALADACGTSEAVVVSSGTAALHLALMALGIGAGDEVIVPDVTWIATSAPVSYVGATVVFADFDPVSWCITADSIEAVLTPRTKAVIVVDLYGNMPDFDPILELCRERNVAVIEDAAEAVGATYKRRPAGSFGECSAFFAALRGKAARSRAAPSRHRRITHRIPL